MRLLTVIPVMGVGGAETVAAALSLDAHARGHEVRLASSGGFRAERVAAAGVPHVGLALDGRRVSDLVRSVRRLRATVRDDRPDLVHAHNVKAALVARAAVGRSVPVLTTLHGVPAGELAAAARILRWATDHVVAVSPHVATQLVEHGFPADRVTVVENAIAPVDRHPRAAARGRLGLPAGVPVVLCLARMVDQKRHDLLVEAWADVPSDAVLLLAGDGPNRPAVEELVRRHGLSGRVRLLGNRTDVDWLLSAADLVVLPTNWEGLPISLLEAMGAGVPVVASAVGGVVETLGPAVRLVEPGSAAALGEGLRELIGDPALRARLGRSGQDLVASRYGPAPMSAAYHDLYDELAHAARGRSFA